MFLLRVQVPELPGALGRVATAIGQAGADIRSLEIIEHGPGIAIDDFIIDLPPQTLPETLVASCQSVEEVHVVWLSHSSKEWMTASDTETIAAMTADREGAGLILTRQGASLFHSSWAVLTTLDHQVIQASDFAPDIAEAAWSLIGDLTTAHTVDLPDEWLPEWGETLLAVAPVGAHRAILLGRQGGPAWLTSELNRLGHLAALATA